MLSTLVNYKDKNTITSVPLPCPSHNTLLHTHILTINIYKECKKLLYDILEANRQTVHTGFYTMHLYLVF